MPVAVVTGASSGIGAAIAHRFLRSGWSVAVVGRRQDRLQSFAASAPPGAVLPVVADLTRAADIAAAADRIHAWQPRLDALIHSAGDFFAAPMAATSPVEFERLWRLMVFARFLLTRELADSLQPQSGQYAAIVHLASLAAHRDFADETAYMSAMHAVVGLARAQDVELRPRGIRACLLSPGLVRTELTQRAGFSPDDLNRALDPTALADSAWVLVEAIRAGAFIAEIFQTPSRLEPA